MAVTKAKVGIVHATIGPYRHPLFEKLSKEANLIVYYCSVDYESRKWDLWPRDYSYKYKILQGPRLRVPVGHQSLNLSIIKELVSNKPDVLIISGYTEPTAWLGFAVAKLLGIRVIQWTEGIKEPRFLLGKLSRPLRALLIKNAVSIIVPGLLSKNYVINLGANPEKVFIAPNAIDNKLFVKISEEYRKKKNHLKAELGFDNRVLILFVGQLIERKGVEYLLHAYSKLEKEYAKSALLVVGSGPLESSLRKIANFLELRNFRIVGSGLTLDHLIRLYSAADIFVLPTLEDVWGFVINEAMACCLPVVSTNAAQAATELITPGENGYVVNKADIDELHAAIRKLVDSPERMKSMGQRSLETIEGKFDPALMAQGFVEAIKYAMPICQKS